MDVLCKFSEVTVPAHENTIWWSHVTGTNVREISPEPWAHNSRPRSTSVRSRTSIPNMHLCKTSDSPPRRQSESTNVLNHGDFTINAETSEEDLWAACSGKVDPYFSCHPPSAPIEVLIIGVPPTLPIAHTLARHDLKAMWASLEQESEEHVWMIPRLLPSSALPRARPPRPSRARVKAEGAARRATRGTRRAIRRLLREIIAALPLLAPGEQQENGTEAGAEVAPSVDAYTSAQAVLPAPSLPATRSVAVQAQPITSSVDKGIMGSRCQLQTKNTTEAEGSGEKRARTPDAWVGRTRALRDSHVRLVLRQLRHIERLNRALDHAVPALKHKQ